MAIQPIILCGGFGKRLWPISRKNKPKQFLNILNNQSLFELTIIRSIKLKNAKKPIIITSYMHEFLVKNVLEKLNIKAFILLEPESKNTAAAIYLAAMSANKNDLLLIMPSDHYIPNTDQFCSSILNAQKKYETDKWFLFGVIPNEPSEFFGYIELQGHYNDDQIPQDVISFKEKPNIELALKMLNTKKHLWNAGIFLVETSTAIDSIKKYAQPISSVCDAVLKEVTIKDKYTTLFNVELFKEIPAVSIDYIVLEREKNIKCLLLSTEWNDVGSWNNFSKVEGLDNYKKKSIEVNGNNFIYNIDEKKITTLDVSNLIIINTNDVIFITKKGHTSHMQELVDQIYKSTPDIVNFHLYDERPWGRFDILFKMLNMQIKKLIILPHKRLSLQYHKKRTEHWFIKEGIATIYLDGKISKLCEGQSIDISQNQHHYIANETHQSLIIIEIQMGSYLGEDDIYRLDDPYNR